MMTIPDLDRPVFKMFQKWVKLIKQGRCPECGSRNINSKYESVVYYKTNGRREKITNVDKLRYLEYECQKCTHIFNEDGEE